MGIFYIFDVHNEAYSVRWSNYIRHRTRRLHARQGEALKGGLSRPLALLTKTWPFVCGPLSSRLSVKLLLVGGAGSGGRSPIGGAGAASSYWSSRRSLFGRIGIGRIVRDCGGRRVAVAAGRQGVGGAGRCHPRHMAVQAPA